MDSKSDLRYPWAEMGENGMALLTRLAAGIIRRRKGKLFIRRGNSQTVFTTRSISMRF